MYLERKSRSREALDVKVFVHVTGKIITCASYFSGVKIML